MSFNKKDSLRRVTRDADKAKEASWRRDKTICEALEHASTREVAVAAGLSPARIHQIRHGK
jgi:translation initiation factor 2 alpha subunit (eIF-2alpha)